MNKLVIFDLDGVLYETRDMHFQTLNRALLLAGMAPISKEDHLSRFNGLPTKTKLNMLFIRADETVERIQRVKQELTLAWIQKNVDVNVRLRTLWTDLHSAGYHIAVVSNAKYRTTNLVLKRLGLSSFRPAVYTPDKLPAKPSPHMFFLAMGEAGSDPEHTVIVEDSPIGLDAARKTGALVIAVKDPDEMVTRVRETLL